MHIYSKFVTYEHRESLVHQIVLEHHLIFLITANCFWRKEEWNCRNIMKMSQNIRSSGYWCRYGTNKFNLEDLGIRKNRRFFKNVLKTTNTSCKLLVMSVSPKLLKFLNYFLDMNHLFFLYSGVENILFSIQTNFMSTLFSA